jgi:hypothetical protein
MDEDEGEMIKRVEGSVVETSFPKQSRTEQVRQQLKAAAPVLTEPTQQTTEQAVKPTEEKETTRRGRKPKEQSAAPQGASLTPETSSAPTAATQPAPAASETKSESGGSPVEKPAGKTVEPVTTPAAPDKGTGEIFEDTIKFSSHLDIGMNRVKFLDDHMNAFYSENIMITTDIKAAIKEKKRVKASWQVLNGRNILIDAKAES